MKCSLPPRSVLGPGGGGMKRELLSTGGRWIVHMNTDKTCLHCEQSYSEIKGTGYLRGKPLTVSWSQSTEKGAFHTSAEQEPL